MNELPRNLDRSRRRHKLMFACFVLAIAVAGACLGSYAKSHSRFKVIGDADPITGYHIEYTVSSRYRMIEAPRLDWRATGRSLSFSLKPPPKALTWIYAHILHRQSGPSNRSFYGWRQDTINHYYFKSAVPPGITVDPQGYPRLPNGRKSMVINREEHTLIAGCPATWYVSKLPGTIAPNMCFYILLVKHRDQPAIFAFSTIDDVKQPIGVASEMLKIRDSIRIVKGP
jgi:hypothetical protein